MADRGGDRYPAAVRAVGTAPPATRPPSSRAMGRPTDGHIGQYSLGGPDNKWTLLAWESADPDGLE